LLLFQRVVRQIASATPTDNIGLYKISVCRWYQSDVSKSSL